MEYKRNVHNVTFDTGSGGEIAAENTVLSNVEYGATIEQPSGYIASKDHLKDFSGWYTDEACSDDKAYDFSTTMPDEDVTLYAKWTAWDKTTSYWMAPAYKMTTGNTAETANQDNPAYTDPETGIIKSAKEIKADADALKSGNATEDLVAEYTEYMKNDNYHLYCKWDKKTTTDLDSYLEFRVIHAGQHDGDGSGLTFCMTHAYYFARPVQMGATVATNAGGWGACNLRTAITGNGSSIQKTYADALSDAITVSKKFTKGSKSTEITTSDDQYWILSYSEMSGTTTAGYADEGSQYQYYAQVVKPDPTITLDSAGIYNYGLMNGATRAGNKPNGSDYKFLWLRSPYLSASDCFMNIREKTGVFDYHDTINYGFGFNICFCL